MPVFNGNFVQKLASCATPQIEPCVIVAKDENEVLDQACQSAVAYWLLGWHEDEIASVLEDEGFPDTIVDHAMEHLEDHSEEILRGGPFAIYEYGQLVKLNNGQSGVLYDKQPNVIVLQMGDELVQIAAEQIDVKVTASLTRAYQMRKEASEKLWRIAQEKDEELPVDYKHIKIEPEEGEKNFPPGVIIENPKGEPVKLVDVESVLTALNAKVEKMLQELLELQAEQNQAQEELDELATEYKSRKARVQQESSALKKQIQDLVDQVFSAVMSQRDITQAEFGIAYEFYGRFVILQQTLAAAIPPQTEPKSAAELKEFYEMWNEYIDTQSGPYAAKLKKANEKIKKQIVKSKPSSSFLNRIFGLFPPTKDRRGHTAQESWLSQAWQGVVSWAESIWQGAQEIYAEWTNSLEPEGQAQLDQMDQMLEATQAATQAAIAAAATQTVISASKRRR